MVNVGQMLVNFSNSYGPIMKMLTGGAYLLGIVFILLGVLQLKMYGESKTMMSTSNSLKLPLTYFIVGSVFLYLPTAIDMMMLSTFGDAITPLGYMDIKSTIVPDDVIMAVLRIVQIVGLISFIRGWIILVSAAKQGAQPALGKALTHIIGGILAINVVGTKAVLSATFGLG
jgi:intracellular multiplication protein IcmC